MKLDIRLRKVEFDAKGFMVATRHALQDSMYQAAQAFVEAAAPNVPVDTGMARGSFLNLQQLLERKGYHVGVEIPTTIQRRLKSGRALRYTHSDGTTWPKGPGSAKRLSTLGSQAFNFTNGKYDFKYSTSVVHFNIHDPVTWESFHKGRVAFLRSLQQTKPARVVDYITIVDG